ncbi:hypothetical protein GCM10022246_00190 [Pedobacter ginsengiterrae]|uniref:Uncharacterized protein n=1 Tax=Pedobacter ginsengiterrae TaxID=871696 RepID=A0ABP7NL12_9SPHI
MILTLLSKKLNIVFKIFVANVDNGFSTNLLIIYEVNVMANKIKNNNKSA